jgi:ABC-type polysaccharide/polyol phosphate transport system ATPase subunit
LPTSPERSTPKGGIVAEHIWKRFRADRVKRRRLHDHLARMGRQMMGRGRGWHWALKDVSFEVSPGESMALIGVNGSGKSTLLKVLSRVTFQTAGRCEAKGRIGALLEIRSGINPLLTGRENIFLYGNILGLSKKQIAERFDAIVDFAELADSIDRQVKYFSSGMQVRLGFSIAAHLEPDILLVDEVLAVGDANFQQKCLRRISEVVASGTTLLFVSHDLAAVEAMCDRAVWMSDGIARAQGPTKDVLGMYRNSLSEDVAMVTPAETGIRILKVEVTGPGGGAVRSGADAEVRMALNSSRSGNARIFFGASEGTAMPIFVIRNDVSFPGGDFEVRCTLKNLPLPRGHYFLWSHLRTPPAEERPLNFSWRPVGSFDVLGARPNKPPAGVMLLSPVYVDTEWEVA